MMRRDFAQLEFELIGEIVPEHNAAGSYAEFMPQSRYKGADTVPLNAAGAGPFCRFTIARGRREAGLYVLTLDDVATYAGECADLAARWGRAQYGNISPKNCFKGGQSTNCRVNAAILSAAKDGGQLQLWFHSMANETEIRREAETRLIQALRPAWNRAKMF